MLHTDDREQINETLALHAHVFDDNQLDRLGELFVPDAVYDMRSAGMGLFDGIDAIREAAARLAASGQGPVAHFVTNVVVSEVDGTTASARSKGLMIMHDGSVRAVTHDDRLRVHEGRWLLSRRVITPVGV